MLIGIQSAYSFQNKSSPIDRLQRLGKLWVLSGKIQISHFGKDKFRWGASIAAAYIGEATYKIAVDFSKAYLEDKTLILPKAIVEYQIEEGKTRMYNKESWKEKGFMINKGDEQEFINKQLSCIDQKLKDVVCEKPQLLEHAQDLSKRLACAYLQSWGLTNKIVRVEFK
jgi:hypothetical protein